MDETRAEQLASEIRRGCDHAADEADSLVGIEVMHRLHPTDESARKLDKQRRRLAHSLSALNGPIRSYHDLVSPPGRRTWLQRLLRWLSDLAARGAAFRGES